VLSTADHLSGLVNTKHRFSENPSGARSYIWSFNRTHVVGEMRVFPPLCDSFIFFLFLVLRGKIIRPTATSGEGSKSYRCCRDLCVVGAATGRVYINIISYIVYLYNIVWNREWKKCQPRRRSSFITAEST